MSVKRFDLGSWLDSPLSRRRLDLAGLEEQQAAVREICDRVRRDGDAALREYGERFDGWQPAPEDGFQVPRSEIEEALHRLAPGDREATRQQAIQPGSQQVGTGTPRHLQDLQHHGW